MHFFDFISEVALQNSDRLALPLIWWAAPVASVIALIFAVIFYRSMMKETEGTDEMEEIAQAVREGAMAYLNRQYRVVGMVFVVMVIIFVVMAVFNLQNPVVPFAFLTGGIFSALAGYIGMRTATNASARTANAASRSLNGGLQVALRGGAVMGLTVVGLALIDIAVWFLLLYYVFPNVFPDSFLAVENPLPKITATMLSFGMGASTQALFAVSVEGFIPKLLTSVPTWSVKLNRALMKTIHVTPPLSPITLVIMLVTLRVWARTCTKAMLVLS